MNEYVVDILALTVRLKDMTRPEDQKEVHSPYSPATAKNLGRLD